MNNSIEIIFNDSYIVFTKQELILTILLVVVAIIFLIYFIINKMNKKEKQQQINNFQYTIEQYAYYIIKCLSISEKNFFKDNKHIKYNLFSQTLYYIYHLYICEQILFIKYTEETAINIILKATDILLEYQSENQTSKIDFKNNMFSSLLHLKSENIKITEKEDMQKLAKLFLEDVNLSTNDAIMILNVFTSFSSFIIYHSEDIINKNIQLIVT
jgi:hypothetical protein